MAASVPRLSGVAGIDPPGSIHNQFVGMGSGGEREGKFPGVSSGFFHGVGPGVPAVEGTGHRNGFFRAVAKKAKAGDGGGLDSPAQNALPSLSLGILYPQDQILQATGSRFR